jgi:hypothetical protein
VRLHGSAAKDTAPESLTDLNSSVYNWDIDAIVKAIG